MKRILIPALAAIVSLSACSHKEEKAEAPTQFVLSDTMRHLIAIDSVRTSNISDEVTLSGQVSFNENNVVKVFPRGSGQVLQSSVSLGDHVTRGQVLAIIRSADIAGSYSDLSSANADVAIAKRQADNAEALYKNGISSEREYSEAKENYQKALAARNKVQSQISITGGSNTSANGQYVLTAPIDGYIVEKKVNAGSFIRSDAADNLFTISDLKTVWVWANVYEADIQKVNEGYPARVYANAYPDKIFEGKIDKVSEVLDPASKALRARIALPNPEMLLKPDMFAKVIVSNEQGEKATCVPTAAVLEQEGKNYAVVYNSDNDLRIAEINVIRVVNDKTFVSSGVVPGQKVITKNQLLIFNQLIGD